MLCIMHASPYHSVAADGDGGEKLMSGYIFCDCIIDSELISLCPNENEFIKQELDPLIEAIQNRRDKENLSKVGVWKIRLEYWMQ